MLDKLNRRSFQLQKKEDFPEESSPIEEPRKKIAPKSKFSKITTEIEEKSPEDTTVSSNERVISRKMKDEKNVTDSILEKSLPSNILNIPSIDFLNNDEMKSSSEYDTKPFNIEELTKKIEKNPPDLFIKIPKVNEQAFKYMEDNYVPPEDNRMRSRSGNFDNKQKSNLAGKLAEIKLKELKYLNLDSLDETKNQSEDFLTSPTLNLASPTIKKPSICKEFILNQKTYQQLKNQIKFLNNAVLTFTLISEFVQKLTDDKIPQNINFWFKEQKTNLDFLIGKLCENEFSEEYIQKGDNIKKFNEKLIEVSQVIFLFS